MVFAIICKNNPALSYALTVYDVYSAEVMRAYVKALYVISPFICGLKWFYAWSCICGVFTTVQKDS